MIAGYGPDHRTAERGIGEQPRQIKQRIGLAPCLACRGERQQSGMHQVFGAWPPAVFEDGLEGTENAIHHNVLVASDSVERIEPDRVLLVGGVDDHDTIG